MLKEKGNERMKQRFGSILREQFEIDNIQEVTYERVGERLLCKPNGGLWSAPCLSEDDKYKTDWHEFMIENSFATDKKHYVTFELKDSAVVYEIFTAESLVEFVSKYSYDEINPMKAFNQEYLLNKYPFLSESNADYLDFLMLKEFYHQGVEVDWEAVFKENDAIFLDCAFSGMFCFWGWDVDTLLVGNKNAIDENSIKHELLD